MSYILALVVALGSFGLYMSAFFLPEVYRKNDFIWSGVGMFYALVLWVCAGRITGGVLLGQMASVALLGWMGWQLIESRRLLTPYDQQTRLPGSSRNLGDLLKLTADELPGRLQSQFRALPQQASGWVNQVTSRIGKSPKLAGKPVRSLPKANPRPATPRPASADISSDPSAPAAVASRTQKTRPQAKTTPASAAPIVTPTTPRESPARPSEVPESPPAQSTSSSVQLPEPEAAPDLSEPVAAVPPTVPPTVPPPTISESDAETGIAEASPAQTPSSAAATTEPWVELAKTAADSTTASASQPIPKESFTLDEVLIELATGEISGEVSGDISGEISTDLPAPVSAAAETPTEQDFETLKLEPDLRSIPPSSSELQPDRSDLQPEDSQPENQPQPQIQDLIEPADGLFELATEPESSSLPLDKPLEELLDQPRSLDVKPLPAQPEDATWEFDWELPSLDSPASNSPAPDLQEIDLQESDLQNWPDEQGAIAQNWQAEFDDDFGDDFGDDFDPEPEDARENAAENAVTISIERLNLSPALADSTIERLPNEAASTPQASAAEMTEDLEPVKSEPSFADETPDDDGLP